jgi:hypothetical protein
MMIVMEMLGNDGVCYGNEVGLELDFGDQKGEAIIDKQWNNDDDENNNHNNNNKGEENCTKMNTFIQPNIVSIIRLLYNCCQNLKNLKKNQKNQQNQKNQNSILKITKFLKDLFILTDLQIPHLPALSRASNHELSIDGGKADLDNDIGHFNNNQTGQSEPQRHQSHINPALMSVDSWWGSQNEKDTQFCG